MGPELGWPHRGREEPPPPGLAFLKLFQALRGHEPIDLCSNALMQHPAHIVSPGPAEGITRDLRVMELGLREGGQTHV